MGKFRSQVHAVSASSSRAGSVLGTFVIAVAITLSARAADCLSPILPGVWKVRSEVIRGVWSGSAPFGEIEPGMELVAVVRSGEFVIQGDPDATRIHVACDGSFSGTMHNTYTGDLILDISGSCAPIFSITEFVGSSVSIIQGRVEDSAALTLQPSSVILDGVLATSDQVGGGFPDGDGGCVQGGFSGSCTQPICAGSGPRCGVPPSPCNAETLPMVVSEYNPDEGVIRIDYTQLPWFLAMQEEVKRLLDEEAPGLIITFEGELVLENVTPSIISVTPQYTQFFLKEVSATNTFTAVINWRNAGPDRRVRFEYGDKEIEGAVSGDTATANLDMGEDATLVRVVAIADGAESDPFEVTLIKVDSGWAGPPSEFSSAGGITYTRTFDWPEVPSGLQSLLEGPFVGGLWSLLGSASNEVEVTVTSQGAGSCTAQGGLNFGLPILGSIGIDWNGTGNASLGGNGIALNGDLTVNFPTINLTRRVGVLDLVPGGTALCSVSTRICDLVNSVGIEGQLTFGVSGSGVFKEGQGNPDWVSGSATLRLGASVQVTFVPEPLDALVSLKVSGGGTGCVTVKFHPNWELTSVGVTLNFNATGHVLLVGGTTIPKSWNFGGGCGGGSPTPAELWERFESAPEPGYIPHDGRVALAIGPDGRMALAWSGLPEGLERPAGDIIVQVHDGTQWQAPVRITAGADADQAPALAFLDADTLLVAWQRGPAAYAGFTDFAAGFEIFTGIYDLATGTLGSPLRHTDNGLADLAPRLERGQDGSVMLVWLQAHPEDPLGNAAQPAALLTRMYEAGQWQPAATAVGGLKGLYGWTAALFDGGTAAIVFVEDRDNQFGTTHDTELHAIRMAGGVWGARVRLTDNAVADWGPRLAYDPAGRLALGWIRDEAVVGVAELGSEAPVPTVWIGADQQAGAGFSHGQLLFHPRGLMAVWPGLHRLLVSTSWIEDPANAAAGSAWSVPALLTDGETVVLGGTVQVNPDGTLSTLSLEASVILDGELPRASAFSDPGFATVALPARPPGFAVRSVRLDGPGTFRITWPSVPGWRNQLELSTDLKTWTPVGGAVIADSTEAAADVAVDPGAGAVFVRVRIEP